MRNIPAGSLAILALALAAPLALCAPVRADDFGMDGMSAAELRGKQGGPKAAPVPRAPAQDDTIGVEAAIRVPYGTIKKAVVMIAASDKDVTIIDPAGPVIGRSGEFLKVINLRINVNGIVLEPVVTLKPYYEAVDTVAIRVQRVQVRASMVPTPGATSGPQAVPAASGRDGEPDFDKETLTADVVKVLTDGVTSALNASLAANDSPLKASDIVTFRYDKKAWVLHIKVSAAAIKRYLPDGYMNNLHLKAFSFDDSGIGLRFTTAK